MGVADNKSYKDMRHFNTGFYGNLTLQDVPSIQGDPEINSTIKENPYLSNVEIEGGELVLDPEMKALFKANGKKHYNGGIDVNLKPDSFIFSDDKTLALNKRDHELFELKTGSNKILKNTPAEVLKRNVDAKHYNTMVSILDDPKSTDLEKNTASKMLEKYIGVLGNIAFIQEQKKGLPTGVPSFSQNTAPVYDPTIKDEIMSQKQYAKYGGPIMARGGDPGKKPNYPMSIYSPAWQHALNMKADEFILPRQLGDNPYAQLQGVQHKNKPGDYGNGLDIQDFLTRQAWYVKNHPNFNVRDRKQLNDFEVAYDNEATRRGFSPYYGGDGFRGSDGMYGNYHDKTPGFTEDLPIDAPQKTYQPQTFDKPQPYQFPSPQVPNGPSGDADAGKEINWQMTPYQKLSQLYNGAKWAGIKRYMPMRSQMRASYMDPQLVNPEQVVGDMRGQMNSQIGSLSSLSPIMRNAQAADAYGQYLDKVPGVRSQYDNQNAQIVNQGRQYNNQVRNNTTAQNMQNDANYYQQSIAGQQNFDNMKDFKSDQWMNNLMGDVQTNQSLAYQLASMKNPAYGFDFQTGNFIRNPKNILDAQGTGTGDEMKALMTVINQITDPKAKADAMTKLFGLKVFGPQLQQQKRGGKFNPYK